MAKKPYTLRDAYEAVARSLRDFGYSDASAEMVRATHEAMRAGKAEMPHGVIGMFAQRQLEEVRSRLEQLPA